MSDLTRAASASSMGEEGRRGHTASDRALVLEYVRSHPHCTQGECDRAHGQRGIRKRFHELVRMGMIRESGVKEDSYTSKQVATYEVTGRQAPLADDQQARVSENRALLQRFEDLVIAHERVRVQEMDVPGTQQAALSKQLKELRQVILLRMARSTRRPSSRRRDDSPQDEPGGVSTQGYHPGGVPQGGSFDLWNQI